MTRNVLGSSTNRMMRFFLFLYPWIEFPAQSPFGPWLPAQPGILTNLVSRLCQVYLRGNVLLKGPARVPRPSSLLRGVHMHGDDDLNGDGLPDAFGTYAFTGRRSKALGVDRLAPGSDLSANRASGYGDLFSGRFQSGYERLRRPYELSAADCLVDRASGEAKYLLQPHSRPSSRVNYERQQLFLKHAVRGEDDTNECKLFPGQPARTTFPLL